MSPSIVQVSQQSTFSFENLASGSYRIRAWCSDTEPVGQTSVVVLEPGGWAWVDMSLGTSGAGRFVLMDSEGEAFTGLQSAEDGTGQKVIGPIVFEFSQENAVRAIATVYSSETSALQGTTGAWSDFFYGQRSRSDRNRRESDVLDALPAAPEPSPQRVFAEAEAEATNQFLVHFVPAQPWIVVVQCGSWSSEPTPLDFRRSGGPHVLILKPDREGERATLPIGLELFSFDAFRDRRR